jgi:hypothetical protein
MLQTFLSVGKKYSCLPPDAGKPSRTVTTKVQTKVLAVKGHYQFGIISFEKVTDECRTYAYFNYIYPLGALSEVYDAMDDKTFCTLFRIFREVSAVRKDSSVLLLLGGNGAHKKKPLRADKYRDRKQHNTTMPPPPPPPHTHSAHRLTLLDASFMKLFGLY